MRVIYDPTHVNHRSQFELYDGVKTPVPEVPGRIEAILSAVRSLSFCEVLPPRQYADEVVFELQSKHYVNYLARTCEEIVEGRDLYPSNFVHDTYAPLVNGTYLAARAALNTALTGAEMLLEDNAVVYALCRPPGHHAGGNYMGGYCYFNNAALAAHHLSKSGRVVILDIDYHHGNGTQEFFYERDDVMYVSVHADPSQNFPYTHGYEDEVGRGQGNGYTKNICVQKNCGWAVYKKAFLQAIEEVRNFNPDYLVVSLGFDGYKDDPIAGFGLDEESYNAVATEIRGLAKPTLLIQEGGYDVESLGQLASCFLQALVS